MSGTAIFINGFAGVCLALPLIIKLTTLSLKTEIGVKILGIQIQKNKKAVTNV